MNRSSLAERTLTQTQAPHSQNYKDAISKPSHGELNPPTPKTSLSSAESSKSDTCILPAGLPMEIFRLKRTHSKPINIERGFGAEKYTVKAKGKLGIRELLVLLGLVNMLKRSVMDFGEEEPFLEEIRVSDIKKESGIKCNYSAVRESLELLQATTFGYVDDEHRQSLIQIEKEDESQTMTVGFNWLIVESIKSFMGTHTDALVPFTIIYKSEQDLINSGKHSEMALLLHARFSQQLRQGAESFTHRVRPLATKLYDVDVSDVTGNHTESIIGGLSRLRGIGWGLQLHGRLSFILRRPRRT